MKLKDILSVTGPNTYICLFERIAGKAIDGGHKPLMGIERPIHLNCDGIRNFIPWMNRKIWKIAHDDIGCGYIRIIVEKEA